MVAESEHSLALYENRLQNNSISILSVPLELGSDARGLRASPQYLFDHGLERMLLSLGATIKEKKIISCPKAPAASIGEAKNLPEIAAVARKSAEATARMSKRGEFVLSLGGDHSIAVGSISGAAREQDIGVIWIDAHPDAHTTETSLSGNVHGMPAAALMGFGNPLLTSVAGNHIKVKPENFLYIGIKDFDQAEIDFIRRERIEAVTMFDIAKSGLSGATLKIDALQKKVGKIWVSMDMDSIDKTYAPGVAMANHGGLSQREVTTLARYIGHTCKILGMDIVEMLPEKDVDGKTAALALELAGLFLGADAGWYHSYMQNYEEAKKIAQVGERIE